MTVQPKWKLSDGWKTYLMGFIHGGGILFVIGLIVNEVSK